MLDVESEKKNRFSNNNEDDDEPIGIQMFVQHWGSSISEYRTVSMTSSAEVNVQLIFMISCFQFSKNFKNQAIASTREEEEFWFGCQINMYFVCAIDLFPFKHFKTCVLWFLLDNFFFSSSPTFANNVSINHITLKHTTVTRIEELRIKG